MRKLRTKIWKIWKKVETFDVFWYFKCIFWNFGILSVFCIFVLKFERLSIQESVAAAIQARTDRSKFDVEK